MIKNVTIISNVHHVICEKFTDISEKLTTEGKFVPEYMVSCPLTFTVHSILSLSLYGTWYRVP